MTLEFSCNNEFNSYIKELYDQIKRMKLTKVVIVNQQQGSIQQLNITKIKHMKRQYETNAINFVLEDHTTEYIAENNISNVKINENSIELENSEQWNIIIK